MIMIIMIVIMVIQMKVKNSNNITWHFYSDFLKLYSSKGGDNEDSVIIN